MIKPVLMSRLARALGLVLSGEDAAFTGIAIDSRAVEPGDLFVAIPGQRSDGHDYLSAAADRGAVAALIERDCAVDNVCALRVPNTVRALGTLGQLLRDDYEGVLVGVTGSAGKTTAKNLLAAILGEAGSTLATEGNLNNEIGVPLTLARLSSDTEFAVVEMGAAKPDDIRYLCEIARPTVSVLLNVGSAHLAGYPDLEALADTKAQILDGLDVDDLAVINADQDWSAGWSARAASARCVSFGLTKNATYRASNIESHGFEGVSFDLTVREHTRRIASHVPGMPGVYNVLAAIAVATELGLSDSAIDRGIAKVAPAAGRGRVHRTPCGATIVDDTYNANPEAVRAAIDSLAQCSGKKTLVLGDMLELGAGSAALHRQVVEHAAARKIDCLIAVGELASEAAAVFPGRKAVFARTADLMAADHVFGADDVVLVKGSRGIALERAVAEWIGSREDIAC
ncbi:MAG: UDP-N-acetylmuramoyl-tripeptide--D-alanyl-D-alanine ligase [Halieaceae bacterium]|nr:UDP-N-acetylmuramoyl-tripeptide--D-alanyl-D-alanine ligase [Halieaceae bacterium]